jgi:hypothetical protein
MYITRLPCNTPLECAVEIGIGGPAVLRAEQLERGERRHELHQRRRAHRLRRIVRDQWLHGAGLLDDERNGLGRHSSIAERLGERRRQECQRRAGPSEERHG